MGALRGRLQRLEAAMDEETMRVACPECGETWRIHEDTALDYLVWEWTEGTGERGHWRPSPDLERLLALDEHDPSVFVLEADGEPWLGEFFAGNVRLLDDVPDLSEP